MLAAPIITPISSSVAAERVQRDNTSTSVNIAAAPSAAASTSPARLAPVVRKPAPAAPPASTTSATPRLAPELTPRM